MLLNGSDILSEVLLEQGVDTIFGYPGGGVLNIYDSFYKYKDRLHHVMTAHEQGAAHAADGYARATGKTGVCIATSGPGATNLVTGLATAYMDSVPMVAITGNVGTSLIGRDAFQEVYIIGITMPITKHNFQVRRVEELADTLRKAFKLAHTGRYGPVLVDIPKDVSAAITEYVPQPPVETPRQVKDSYPGLEEIARVINTAKRPYILFGGGVRLSDAGDEVRELINRADIPASYTLMASGVLAYGEKNNMGLLGMHGCFSGNKAADNCDVLINIGSRFSDRVALNMKKFGGDAKIIHIDIDPSEVGKNIKVDYSVIGDVKDVLQKLLPMIEAKQHLQWQHQIDAWKTRDYHPKNDASVIKPHQLVSAICEMAGPDATYTTDVGQHQIWAAQYLHLTKGPNHFLTSGGLGTMGYGYGAAIGASFGKDVKGPVIHLTGDGSFHMNMNEACTAVSYGLPIISVIFNNRVLGMVRQWQTVFYGKRYSSSDPERVTDYVKVIEGFGGVGYHVETLAEFKEAFAKALESKVPVWIDCVIDKDERVLPMIPGGGTSSDTILD
ncbi:MAG: biosynthetic-type acetolactate synthase large subunit [Clostridia bacterium]|nr:biosynthetic-type acetolactate synthase large subunit [Clostridia bacterium]MBQ7728101.1 biosynthetic-type acetolactate synthase large subunit [Clostridia bacterium]